MEKYRIKKNTYFRESKADLWYKYRIQILKKFLWFEWWSNLKVYRCYGIDCYNETITFDTMDEALEYLAKYKKNKNKECSKIINLEN